MHSAFAIATTLTVLIESPEGFDWQNVSRETFSRSFLVFGGLVSYPRTPFIRLYFNILLGLSDDNRLVKRGVSVLAVFWLSIAVNLVGTSVYIAD